MKLKPLASALMALSVLSPALAQNASSAAQKVEVTGSSIKRLADQGALPITVITADEIQQLGVTSAEGLINRLGANVANVDNATSRNNVFGSDQDRLTGGSSFANLRGLGPTGTLVLLNGRRVSTHGMSGGAVDLNAIPMAAVARVEVLTDGASALYGTDAIGGVINFILKRDFKGLDMALTASNPQASGGGDMRRLAITGGFGDLARERFNLMASVTVDRNTILRGIDRPWANGYQPERSLTPDTTSAPHANVLGAAGTALPATGSTVGATDPVKYTNLNLLAIQNQCDALPFSVPMTPNIDLWSKFGYTNANSRYRCATDYGRQFMLMPPKEAVNVVARGVFRLSDAHTAFLEFVGSRTDVLAEFTPFQFSTTSNALTHYPVGGPHYLNLKSVGANDFDATKPIAYRLRMSDWGYRTLENTSENSRLATGLEGDLGGYSYKLGLSRGKAEGSSLMVDGYAFTQKLVSALASGKINPFLRPGQQQSAEAMELIESTKARGRLFGGDTSVVQFDGSLAGELARLPAGALDFAVGFDVRRESYFFSGSQDFTCVSTFTTANAALPNSVMGCPGNAPSPDRTRSINAVYGELLVPLASTLQATLQLRHDRYSEIGNTTNPKLALRFQPTRQLVLRGSVNTGFRAPTVQQLNLGTAELALTGTFQDPERCPADPTQCARQSLPYRTGGNPTLKPETSRQGSVGMALQATPELQITADYWQVALDNRIRNLSPTFMITNYDLFRDSFIRDANGNVRYIQAGWVNAAESTTKGIDLSANYSRAMQGGRLTTGLSGTRLLSHKERLIPTAPLQELVGEWSNTTLYLPWRITGTLGWKKGVWNSTASFNYSSGYKDEDRSPYDATPDPQRRVSPYSTVNLLTTYTGVKNMRVSAGVINLFDRKPPFTWHNVDQVIGAGWDPRVADPRGRTFSITLGYAFL